MTMNINAWVRWGALAAMASLAWRGVVGAGNEEVRVTVGGIWVHPLTQAPAVLLHDEDRSTVLPIFIGETEASAILRYMNDVQMPRPLTHDLIGSVMTSLGGNLERVIVNDFKNNTFFARLDVRSGDDLIGIDARPSDAIAVALKHGVEIYVARGILDAAGQPHEDRQPAEPERPEPRERRPRAPERTPDAPLWM